MYLFWFRQIKYNTHKWNLKKEIGGVENKLPHVGGLVTTGVFNTKSGEVDNKIPDVIGLVIAMILKNKIPDVSGIVATGALNTKIGAFENKISNISGLATKAELKAEQDEIVKLQANDLSYFLAENCGGDVSPNMFVYQPTFSTLELIKARIMVLVGNQKVCISLDVFHYMVFYYLTQSILGVNWECKSTTL